MNNLPNWNQIKQALKENFIEIDFQRYSTSAFSGVDFDKGLEIFRYILEKKLINYDETKQVLDALSLYAKGQQNKDILEKMVLKYEPFLKKTFEIIGITARKKIALSWCYNKLFDKLLISQTPGREEFYSKTLTGQIENPTYPSTHFLNGFLTDGTEFGKALHSSYYLRNSNIHNDSPLTNRQISQYITDCVNSYLYFIFKYYSELCTAIPSNELQSVNILSLKNLASLSGGAYNPHIENEVKRDNIIQTIENKLKNLDVLSIEGEDGLGKTTLLHQFVAKHSNSCFAYFIDSKDSNTYTNQSILYSFCNQFHFQTKQQELDEGVDINNYSDESWLKNYLISSTNLLTSNRNSNQTFFFIIDGLDEISQDRQNDIREQILDALPYLKSNIKLILTGKQKKTLLKKGAESDKFEMVLLSKVESKFVFGDIVNELQFDDINKVSQNNVGKIVFFRDLINKYGIPIESIINNLSFDMKEFYSYLWNNHFQKNDTSELILAIISFQEEKYNAAIIAKILETEKLEEKNVIELLQNIPFVRKNARGTYEYIFDGFTNFAQMKLSKYKNKIDKVVIDYLINNLQSLDSLIRLPEMYKKTGKTDDLLMLLNNEKWNQLLIESEKISVVSRVSNVALQVIQDKNENKYIPTILKYSILKSALKELSQTTVWQNEILTNLALGEYLWAENLANLAFLKEDKLKMLASIAKAYVEKGSKVPETILKKIEELYEDIDASKDFKNVKEAAVEIASLLMYSNPKLAFRLIEDLSGNVSDNDNAFDWALAQISLSVHSDLKNLEDVSKEDINIKVYSKIRNPRIKEFADAILYLSENQTSEQIIDKINQLESTSQKMFLIRNWLDNNTKDVNVANVIELGLELVVNKSDKYIPTSSDYKIFAEPLPFLENKDKTIELIYKIEQYTASIENTSARNDLLAIKLFIARALCNFDFKKGDERLYEIYFEIDEISDLAIKCTCLAIYANEATRIKNAHQDKNLDVYLDTARLSINDNIDKILEQTASHFEIVQSIITNLVRLYPDDAISICQKLNKAIDRDNAFLESLSIYLRQNIEKVETDIVDILLNSIIDLDIQKIAISEIINRLGIESNNQSISKFYKYFDKVNSLFDNSAKCLLYVHIISILEKHKEDYSLISEKLNDTWNELEKSVYKIELGFEIAYNAAFLESKNLSISFLRAAKDEKARPDLLLDSPSTSEVFNLIIELTIRLFAGLVFKNSYNQNDIENLEKIINSLPSEKQQMKLWSSLILRIIPKSKDDKLANQLIRSYILPKLSKIKNKNERINTILEIIVVLYYADKQLLYLEELPNQKLRDIALSKVCKYLFTKCLPEDDCDNRSDGYTVNFEILKEITELTSRMSNDYFIASQVMEIRKSLDSKNTIISGQQRVDIQNKFEYIANTKLPDNNNIRHLGYKILVKANAICIKAKQRWDIDWNPILEEIDDIPNLSDRILLWVSVAELLPQEFSHQKLKLITKAEESVYKLPSFLDTVGRLEMIFLTLNRKQIVGVGLKSLFDRFIQTLNKNSSSHLLKENYRNILDVAYATDPTIARTLVGAFDKDTARLNTGSNLKNHLSFLEFQSSIEKKMGENKSEQELLESKPNYFFKIIEKKLARLNASKTVSDNLFPKDLIYQLNLASERSIYESYNAFSYFIERLVLMYEQTDESSNLIRKSFLELVDICNLVKLLSIRNADKIRSLLDVISEEEPFDVDKFESIKSEIDIEKYKTIVELLNKKIAPETIAIISGIGIEKISLIQENI